MSTLSTISHCHGFSVKGHVRLESVEHILVESYRCRSSVENTNRVEKLIRAQGFKGRIIK
jgi:hypothetical protein